ncbi:hypothetical protein BC827DRAFT_1224623 [Russula dissimulans]|nr:hypothetical protein BC827DRAFT_1224623 [Russula dissimulans]
MPSRSPWLKVTLKLPTQTQEPFRSEDEEEDDHPHGGDGKRPLTTRRVVLTSLGPLMFRWSIDGTPCEEKQLNEAEIALRCEETACKRKHLSEKRLEDEKAHVHPIFIPFSRSDVSYR